MTSSSPSISQAPHGQTPLSFLGVRLYLLEGSIPPPLLEEAKLIGRKLDEIVELILSRQSEKDLDFFLESVGQSYLRLNLQNVHLFNSLAIAHPGPFHLSAHQSIHAELDFLDSLPDEFLHPILKDDLEWCLLFSKQFLSLLLSDQGFVHALEDPSFLSLLREIQQGFELPSTSPSEESQAPLRGLLSFSIGNLCLFSAMQHLHQAPPRLHPLFESFCEKAYWGFRSFSKEIPSFHSFNHVPPSQRVELWNRWFRQFTSLMPPEEKQGFFQSLERR